MSDLLGGKIQLDGRFARLVPSNFTNPFSIDVVVGVVVVAGVGVGSPGAVSGLDGGQQGGFGHHRPELEVARDRDHDHDQHGQRFRYITDM